MTRQPHGVPWGSGRKCLEIRRKIRTNPLQATCDWGTKHTGVTGQYSRGITQVKLHN